MASNRTEDENHFWNNSPVGFSFDDDSDPFDEGNNLFGDTNKSKSIEELKAELTSLCSTTSDSSDDRFEGAQRTRDLPSYLINNSTIEQELDRETFGLQGLPINLQNLKIPILEEDSAPPIEKTLRSLLICENVSLEAYKTLDQKITLLTKGLEMNDGNAIITIIIFLSRSLKPSLFRQLLLENKQAADIYLRHLTIKNEINHVYELNNMLGRTRDALMIKYKSLLKSQANLEKFQKELEHFYKSDCSISDEKMALVISEQINLNATHKLLKEKHPLIVLENYQSVLKTLSYLSSNFYENSSPLLSINSFKLTYKLNVKQHAWVVLNSLVKAQSWPQVQDLLISKGWLGATRDKCLLPLEEVCYTLKDAPVDLITQFLRLIEDTNKRLAIAKKLKCHLVVIDVFASQKDRAAILSYRTNLEENSKESIYCDSFLRNTSFKWKN